MPAKVGSSKNYTYSFIRKDLPLEQQLVQLAHSALEAGRSFGNPGGGITHLILLEAQSETQLMQISLDLKGLGIKHEIFFEPDDDMGWTSLTTEPLHTKEQRKYFFKHKLYRAKNPACEFLEKLEAEQVEMPPEFQTVVDKHFWEMI